MDVVWYMWNNKIYYLIISNKEDEYTKSVTATVLNRKPAKINIHN